MIDLLAISAMDRDTAPTPQPTGRRPRRRGALLAAALVLTAVGASAAASAALSEPAPTPAEKQLQEQIDGMVAGGMPADHPKVLLLREQLEQLRAGASAEAPPEPGVDVAAALEEAEAEAAAEDAGTAARAVVRAGRLTGVELDDVLARARSRVARLQS